MRDLLAPGTSVALTDGSGFEGVVAKAPKNGKVLVWLWSVGKKILVEVEESYCFPKEIPDPITVGRVMRGNMFKLTHEKSGEEFFIKLSYEELSSELSGRTHQTTANIFDKNGTTLATSESFCSLKDNFNKRIGREIALGRAFKDLGLRIRRRKLGRAALEKKFTEELGEDFAKKHPTILARLLSLQDRSRKPRCVYTLSSRHEKKKYDTISQYL